VSIRRVIDAVVSGNVWNVEWIYTLQTTDVEPILLGVGSTLVMRVDATDRAKIVLGGVRVELIRPEDICALDDSNTRQPNGRNDGTFASADRAVASSRVDDSIRKIEHKLHRATMTRGLVFGEYFDAANCLDHLPNSCVEANALRDRSRRVPRD
jgi:hypothetical protein